MAENIKTIVSNRKAFHDYFIESKFEAGLQLKGTEVKALREGKCSIVDSYARIIDGELWIIGMNIPVYKNAGYATHDPYRTRKLLLHKEELRKIFRLVMEKGVTIIPLKVYFKNGWAKVELGIARGKKKYDKREDIAQRDRKREEDRMKKQYKIK
ncbi:MAG: SsrA-binding protein SmpB [Calditrichia bacterium]